VPVGSVRGMKYGFVMAYGDARAAAELAARAEEHGWDGFFVWESIWGIDAWAMLAAAAMTTERIRLGTMLTPLPRRKPWDVAGQASTVDNLSDGRVILSVGLGVTGEDRFWLFEDDPGRKVRAELMDESLAMLQHLWRDQPFDFHGKHYRSRKLETLVPPAPPPPVQQPRIPTWVVGAWPRTKSMRRAALQDGWLPHYAPITAPRRQTGEAQGERTGEQPGELPGAEAGQLPDAEVGESPGALTPELLAEGVEWIRRERAIHGLTMDGYEIATEGTTSADDPKAAEQVKPWADAGATWWIDADWSSLDPIVVREQAERRLTAGPPRIEP
jgi:alkanesulfonate monooxygenase SsuD/methylene tetrahydromethanopterin reductase-like flavin-dependent oxidoreductase (luciferase family)